MSRCSYCGHNGHNSRTCPDRGVRLFGVRLTSKSGVSTRKSFSVGNISDCPINAKLISSTTKCSGRKKGLPWSEEEHRRFLVGLETIGKGNWRGISKSYVTTRTPAQVASHAQKYFLRQRDLDKTARKSSLLDTPIDMQPSPTALHCNAKSFLTDGRTRGAFGCSTRLSLGISRESTEKQATIQRRSIGVARSGLLSVGIDGISASRISSLADLGMKLHPTAAPSTTCNRFIWSQWKINSSEKTPVTISPFPAMIDDEFAEHGTQLNLSIAPPSMDPPALSLGLNHQPSTHLAFRSDSIDSNGSISGPISVI